MAKITQPTAPAPKAADVEAPAAPDISILIGQISPLLAQRKEGEDALASNSLDIIIAIREFRDENPGLERPDARLAIQTAVAEKYGLKLSAVQNDNKPDAKGYSAYTLVSALLSASWPKGEAEEKKVAKAIAAGKGYVEVRKAASKSNKNTQANGGDKNKITAENFATKLSVFLTKAQTDMGISMADVILETEAVLRALEKAPAA